MSCQLQRPVGPLFASLGFDTTEHLIGRALDLRQLLTAERTDLLDERGLRDRAQLKRERFAILVAAARCSTPHRLGSGAAQQEHSGPFPARHARGFAGRTVPLSDQAWIGRTIRLGARASRPRRFGPGSSRAPVAGGPVRFAVGANGRPNSRNVTRWQHLTSPGRASSCVSGMPAAWVGFCVCQPLSALSRPAKVHASS